MQPERARDRELVDRARDRRWRRKKQRIDKRGAGRQLPDRDCEQKRNPAAAAARAGDKARAAKFDLPRVRRGFGWRRILSRRAVKHAGPRARRRSLLRGSVTTARSATPA